MILPTVTAIEILEKVDAFYNSAWNKLIIAASVLIAVIGIVIPILINWWQSRTLKIREEAIRAEFSIQLKKYKKQIRKEMEERSKKELDKLTGKIDRKIAFTEAGTFFIQANNFFSQNRFKRALHSYLIAAKNIICSDTLTNISKTNDRIVETLKKVHKKDLEDLETAYENNSIPNYLNELKERDTDGVFIDIIIEIKEQYDQAKERE